MSDKTHAVLFAPNDRGRLYIDHISRGFHPVVILCAACGRWQVVSGHTWECPAGPKGQGDLRYVRAVPVMRRELLPGSKLLIVGYAWDLCVRLVERDEWERGRSTSDTPPTLDGAERVWSRRYPDLPAVLAGLDDLEARDLGVRFLVDADGLPVAPRHTLADG